jgi:hypothetical protein
VLENSFLEGKNIWEQLKTVQPNNLDEENVRQVETFDVLNWACSENLGGCFAETSAKNLCVEDAFSLLLGKFLRQK